MRIIKADQYQTTQWSGGTTTELFIWPENSSYAERNFTFRLSTATVKVDASTFTSLPGVKRTLMVLSGEMALQHEGHHECVLGPFEVDQFEGGWITHSKGQCADLNLMRVGPHYGDLSHFTFDKGELANVSLTGSHNLLFVLKGKMKLMDTQVNEGDLVDLEDLRNVDIEALDKLVLIKVEVFGER